MHPDLMALAATDAEDRRIKAIDRALANAGARLADARAAVERATADDTAARAALAALVAAERQLQREVEEYRGNRAAAIRMLEGGHGNADAAERQRARSEAMMDDAETRSLVNLEAQDPARTAVKRAEDALAAAKAARLVAEAEVPALVATLDAERILRVAARDRALVPLDRETRSRYLAQLERKGSAVAYVKADACSACNIAVFQQHLSDLLRGVIVPCRGCLRWLIPAQPREPVTLP